MRKARLISILPGQNLSSAVPGASRGAGHTLTFHLHEVQLVDGLQQRGVVEVQVEIRGHPGRQRPLSPLVLGEVHPPDERVRDLAARSGLRHRGAACWGPALP